MDRLGTRKAQIKKKKTKLFPLPTPPKIYIYSSYPLWEEFRNAFLLSFYDPDCVEDPSVEDSSLSARQDGKADGIR